MSVHIQSMVWFREFNTPAQKLVALCLADFCDDDGKCWPSNALVARKCGLSDVTVENAISVFLACGLITREARVRDDGSRTSSLTRFNVSVLEMESRSGRKLAIAEAASDRRYAQEGENEPRVLGQKSTRKPGGIKQGGVGENQAPPAAKTEGGLEPSVNHQNSETPFIPPSGVKNRLRRRYNSVPFDYKNAYSAMCDVCGMLFAELTKPEHSAVCKAVSEIASVFQGTDQQLADAIENKVEQLKSQDWVNNITPGLIARYWNTQLK